MITPPDDPKDEKANLVDPADYQRDTAMSEDPESSKNEADSDSSDDAESSPWIAPWLEPWMITAAYFLCSAYLVSQHIMWRDELQAWAIVWQSPTLVALWENLRFEGHPGLWHLLLWLLYKAGAPFASQQLLHLAITTGVVWVFARWSPFTFWQKLLFAFSYFPLFEYGLPARNYSLSILLLFVACVILTRETATRSGTVALCAVLFLLPQVSAFGALIAVALAVTLAGARLLMIKPLASPAPVLFPLLSTLFGIALFYLQIFRRVGDNGSLSPAPDSVTRILFALESVPKSLFPNPGWKVPEWFALWNTSWIASLSVTQTDHLYLAATLCAIIVSFTAISIAKQRRALLLLCAGVAGQLLFIYAFVMSGTMRYAGTAFFLWIAAIWIAICDRNEESAEAMAGEPANPLGHTWRSLVSGTYLGYFVTFSLAMSCVASAQFLYLAQSVPFSQSKVVADWLDEPPQKGMPVVIYPEYVGTPIAVRRQLPFYSLARQADATFCIWKPANIWIPGPEVRARLEERVARVAPRPLIYIGNNTITPRIGAPDVTPIAMFGPSVSTESYIVYILRQTPRGMESVHPSTR
ncbi:hypothetical protein DB346_20185 [Verrucomicrobia bacterium LW23]|nr:hypothetical protein DB346_20185 [Verrucomicrobia bacterium LW23]